MNGNSISIEVLTGLNFKKWKEDFLFGMELVDVHMALTMNKPATEAEKTDYATWERSCDTPNPGCPLTTRQPAEIYESHVMRPIQVQKWLLGPTYHAHKMYILYKNDLFTILFNYNLYKNGSIAHKFYKKHKIRQVWPFLLFYGPGCVSSPSTSSVPEKWSHDGVSKAQ